MQKRLFIVSNRLPVNISGADEKAEVNISSGGLVSAISSFLSANGVKNEAITSNVWIGVPGCNSTVWPKILHKLPESDFEYIPVFLNKRVYDLYYNGFSNSVIWPLFHYFPSYVDFISSYYDAYLQVNLKFAEVLVRSVSSNDIVWIHDYHLFPLASLLRERIPGITIGFFLHIPFPSYEVFRVMPRKWQNDIVQGMLGADLIGFQTLDYTSHFFQAVQALLGIESEMHILRHKGRLVKAEVFPISIDFNKFHEAFDDAEVVRLRGEFQEKFQGKKVIFSVDRLDYTKGVQNRLKAYELFLHQFPQYKEQVVFVLVVIPSRDLISKYAERKKLIDEYIGKLNSSIGNIHWQPVIYQYNTLEFSELVAMYSSCDLALITPLRDGMNLVAKEFVASRKDKKGVLIISEFAGAIKELTEALPINPNDTEDIVLQMKRGLDMDETEQRHRMDIMQHRLMKYDVTAWASDFFKQLNEIKQKQKGYNTTFFDVLGRLELVESYRAASRRVILLDYDGTLRSFTAIPSEAEPEESLSTLLEDLAKNPQNELYIISGRDSATLEAWFGRLPINLIAEHGAVLKNKDSGWDVDFTVDNNWIPAIEERMNQHVKLLPGSFVERKKYSVAWHYRRLDEAQGELGAKGLCDELMYYCSTLNIQIVRGNKVIEVRNTAANKGVAVRKILNAENFDFILACGDDTTDEDMFFQLLDEPNSYSIKIGVGASYAKYNFYTIQMLISLLESLRYVN